MLARERMLVRRLIVHSSGVRPPADVKERGSMAIPTRRSAAAIAILVGIVLLIPAHARAATQPPIPVVGSVTGGGTLSGVFTLSSFAVRSGQVVAIGTLS